MDSSARAGWGRTTAGALVLVLSVVVIGLGGLAGWLRVQLLDTDTWVETSQQTLEEPEVQDALATWAADEIYKVAKPEQRLEEVLPPRLQPLALPASVALRSAIDDAAKKAMASDAVEQVWVTANRRAHERFVRIVEGDDPIVVETSNGLRLDLRPVLERIADRVGLPAGIVDRIPAQFAEVAPKQSQEMQRALNVMQWLNTWAPWLPFLGAALFGAGLWLVRGRRRSALAWWGFGLLVMGIVVAGLRSEIGPYIANAMTDVTTWRAAILATWENVSWQLVLAARTVSIVGLFAMISAWIGGHGVVAEWLRSHVGGWVHRRFVVTWAAMVVLLGIFIRMSPALGSRTVRTQLLLFVLGALGSWAMLRQVSRDARELEHGRGGDDGDGGSGAAPAVDDAAAAAGTA